MTLKENEHLLKMWPSNGKAALLSFQNPFTKDCGSDDVCVSDLVLSVKTDTKATR